MKKQRNKNSRVMLLFGAYCTLMLYLLFVRGRAVGSELPYWEQVAGNYNLRPFHTILNYWDILARPEYYLSKWEAAAVYKQQAKFAIVNLIGNVLMFIPLGFFLPILWKKLQKIWKTFLVTCLVIVAIEVVQLLSLRGSCDVDDLILNLIGVVSGYVLWRILRFCNCIA